MDIFQLLRQEYLLTLSILQEAIGQTAETQLPLYVVSCWMQIWSRTQQYAPEYAKAVTLITSQPAYTAQIISALSCCGAQRRELAVPELFKRLVAHGKKQDPSLPQKFIIQLERLLSAGAVCNGDFTSEEASTLLKILKKLGTYVRQQGIPFQDITTLSHPITLPKASSSLQSDIPAPPLQSKNIPQAAEAMPAITDKPVKQGFPAPVKKAPAARQTHNATAQTLDTLLAELDSLVGLEQVKKDVHSLANFIQLSALRQEHGLKVPTVSYHLVFTGNPGTGKTTVARLVAQIYHQLGLLPQGHLVEADRSTLVAGYLGQTALKTQDVIRKALGGVLFIDEAYALVHGEQDSYGKEAIETLLKAMEDHRGELIVIVAGYDGPMQEFIDSNPGLASRFNKYFHFPDYNGTELHQIFARFCQRNDYFIRPDAAHQLFPYLTQLYQDRPEHFGNARTVRNLFEKVICAQADRIVALPDADYEDLVTLTLEDLKAVIKET